MFLFKMKTYSSLFIRIMKVMFTIAYVYCYQRLLDDELKMAFELLGRRHSNTQLYNKLKYIHNNKWFMCLMNGLCYTIKCVYCVKYKLSF